MERLRVAWRSAEERGRCLAEQLRNRDEEVRLLQERVERLCSQEEQNAAKLKQQQEMLQRWRAYIRFLEKIIRDLKAYIVSQAGASFAAFSAPSEPCPQSSSVSGKFPRSPRVLRASRAREGGRLRVPFKEQRDHRGQLNAGGESPLAAVGYSLLPLPVSPYEPSLTAPSSAPPSSPSRTPLRLQRGRMGRRCPDADINSEASDGRTMERLERLMHDAAGELRATAAAARRATSARQRAGGGSSRPLPLGGASSFCSLEPSTLGIRQDNSISVSRKGGLSESFEAMQDRGFSSSPAYAVSAARVPGGDYTGYSELSSRNDLGSISELSAFWRGPIGSRGCSPLRCLSKGAAATQLAKEIAVRFPTAFERLRRTSPLCKLQPRR